MFSFLDLEFLGIIFPLLIKGALITVELTVLAIVFGTLIGLMVALAKLSPIWPLRAFGNLYTWVLRGVPLLVQLYVLYYGLAQIGVLELNAFTAAVTGLSLCAGAYIAEIIRAGIQSIDHGQKEAALSLGMSSANAMRRVILPQAMRNILPPLGNEFITSLKDTSLVSVITMIELMRTGVLLDVTYFRSMEIYLSVAVIYLLLTTLFVYGIDYMERRFKII
ncbi:amino acid ABC transporter permease [Clostridia bacterium]|nr:amino acid ABC transporter permease [Clostridia bacterium]